MRTGRKLVPVQNVKTKCAPICKDAMNYVILLKACAKKKDLRHGTRIHEDILKKGLLEKVPHVGNALVNMYAKCGAIAKARIVLQNLPARTVVTWNTLIAGYVQEGMCYEALNCFDKMLHDGLLPNAITFTCVLKACGSTDSIDKGQKVHDEIASKGLLRDDIMLITALVDMYARCGALEKAREVLNEVPLRDAILWNVLIAGYVQQGQGYKALDCFSRMLNEGLSPDAATYSCILKAIGGVKIVHKGKQIHDSIISAGILDKNIVLGTALVDMYSKCGAMEKAEKVLLEIPSRDVISWNTLITGYNQQGRSQEALNCYDKMQNEGLSPDACTFTCLLKACGSMQSLEKGKQIHDELLNEGWLETNVVLGNALVDMYAKCGALNKAREVFETLPVRDLVSWSALIAGYAQQGWGDKALKLFELMKTEGLSPDAVAFSSILKACASSRNIQMGRQFHQEIVNKKFLHKDILLGNALVDMYIKCGALEKAREVLDDLPVRDAASWSTLITVYAQQGQGKEALRCFKQMQKEGLHPDAVTFVSVLNACSHAGLVDEGEMCYLDMSDKYGIAPSLDHQTCMVDLFGRAGHFDKALGVIKEMHSSDHLPAWISLLGACKKWGNVKVGRLAFEEAIQVDINNTSAYILMANIYAAAGMQRDAEVIEALKAKLQLRAKPFHL